MHAALTQGQRLMSANLVSSAEGKQILSGISHMASCPRPAWVFFVIFFLLHRFASRFSSPPSVFSRRGRCFDAILGSNALSLSDVKTPPPWLPWAIFRGRVQLGSGGGMRAGVSPSQHRVNTPLSADGAPHRLPQEARVCSGSDRSQSTARRGTSRANQVL